jgi:2'-5' RNA ligase
MTKHRLFIALTLPPPFQQSLFNSIQPFLLKYPGFKPEPAEKLHITLKFLGHTEVKTDVICQAIYPTIKNFKPVSLTLTNFDCFIQDNGCILYAQFSPSTPIAHLANKIQNALYTIGFPLETRPFKLHITLARGKGKSYSYWKEVQKQSRKLITDNRKPITFVPSSIELMESKLSPEGSKYKIIHIFNIGTV